MKKILYTTVFLCLLTGVHAKAPNKTLPLQVGDPEIVRTDSTVRLTLSLEAIRGGIRPGTTFIFAPQISNNQYVVSFRPVVVEAKRSRISRKRRQWAAGNHITDPDAIFISKRKAVFYEAEVPLQEWMQGADITVETVNTGCCHTQTYTFYLARNVIPAPEPEPEWNPGPMVTKLPDLTVADSLGNVFPFVLPRSEFDPENPIRFYDDERDNAITIYYHINRYDIDPAYTNNRHTLNNLIATIEIIREDLTTEVTRVVVAGFASPEGPFKFNDRLAWERAVSVKQYIMNASGLADELISIYNGSADWQGVRLLVSKDHTMPGRKEVLHILEHVPVSERMSAIRQLQNGAVYDYMATQMFPRLRNGSFIRVFYDKTTK